MEKVYIENAKKHTDKVCPTFNKKIDLNISIGTHLESIFHRTSSAVQKTLLWTIFRRGFLNPPLFWDNMAAIYNQVSPSPSLYFTHLISGSSFYENIAHKFRYSSFLYDNFPNGLVLEYIKYMSNVWILFNIWYSYCLQTDENSTTNKDHSESE